MAGDGNQPPLASRPQSILFACTFNAIRSPMAEALGRALFGRNVYFESVGLRAGELDGFAIAVMAELGIDISKYKPRTFDDLEDMAFDTIISLSPEAHHRALEYTRTMAVEVVYWPTVDPTAVEGDRETRLAAYRAVRDRLDKRIRELLAA
jgi:protein-tyrosine-phosphatase